MANTEQIQRQYQRQQGERSAALTAITALFDRADRGGRQQVYELGVALGEFYELGRKHANERIALRLDLEEGQDVTVIPLTDGLGGVSNDCVPGPHAHLRFLEEPEGGDPARDDSRN